MIVFGGVIFWIIVAIFIFTEIISLYSDNDKLALFLPIGLALVFIFCVGNKPNIDWRYLMIYPVGAIVWLPAYWYLSLRRVYNELLKLKSEYDGDGNWLKSLPYKYHEHVYPSFTKAEGIKIQHPSWEDLSANAVSWPLSAPIFMLDNVIHQFITSLTQAFNRIRDTFSIRLTEE